MYANKVPQGRYTHTILCSDGKYLTDVFEQDQKIPLLKPTKHGTVCKKGERRMHRTTMTHATSWGDTTQLNPLIGYGDFTPKIIPLNRTYCSMHHSSFELGNPNDQISTKTDYRETFQQPPLQPSYVNLYPTFNNKMNQNCGMGAKCVLKALEPRQGQQLYSTEYKAEHDKLGMRLSNLTPMDGATSSLKPEGRYNVITGEPNGDCLESSSKNHNRISGDKLLHPVRRMDAHLYHKYKQTFMIS